MPDLHYELIDAPGSVRNLEALETGAADLGLAAEEHQLFVYPGAIVPISWSSRMTRALSIVIARNSFASETPGGDPVVHRQPSGRVTV